MHRLSKWVISWLVQLFEFMYICWKCNFPDLSQRKFVFNWFQWKIATIWHLFGGSWNENWNTKQANCQSNSCFHKSITKSLQKSSKCFWSLTIPIITKVQTSFFFNPAMSDIVACRVMCYLLYICWIIQNRY